MCKVVMVGHTGVMWLTTTHLHPSTKPLSS